MPAFLTCSLVLCAYLMSILALGSSRAVRVSASRLAVILMPVALIVFAAILLFALALGSWDDMLMLMTVLSPAAAMYPVRRNRSNLT